MLLRRLGRELPYLGLGGYKRHFPQWAAVLSSPTPYHPSPPTNDWAGAICCGADGLDALLSLAALCVVHCNRDDGLLDSSESHIYFPPALSPMPRLLFPYTLQSTSFVPILSIACRHSRHEDLEVRGLRWLSRFNIAIQVPKSQYRVTGNLAFPCSLCVHSRRGLSTHRNMPAPTTGS